MLEALLSRVTRTETDFYSGVLSKLPSREVQTLTSRAASFWELMGADSLRTRTEELLEMERP